MQRLVRSTTAVLICFEVIDLRARFHGRGHFLKSYIRWIRVLQVIIFPSVPNLSICRQFGRNCKIRVLADGLDCLEVSYWIQCCQTVLIAVSTMVFQASFSGVSCSRLVAAGRLYFSRMCLMPRTQLWDLEDFMAS